MQHITSAIIGDKISFSRFPILPQLRHIPRANPSSFFLNHSIIKANCAVFKFSPPKEKIILPRVYFIYNQKSSMEQN